MKLFLFILLLTFSYGQKQIRSIDFDEARQIVETQSGIVVDARNPKDYDAGHFPNAINQYARWRELSDIFTDLKKDQFIMVYCSHNRCPYADRVAGMLQASGFTNLAVYHGGVKDWLDNGYQLITEKKMTKKSG